MRPGTCKEASDQILRRQHSCITRAQLRECGFSDGQIKRMVSSRYLTRVYPHTFRLSGVAESWPARLTAGLLWLGDDWVVGLRSAARLWRFDDCESNVLEFIGTRRVSSTPANLVLHVTKDLPGRHRARVDGIRVTSASRTLIDLGAVVSLHALEAALESAFRMGLSSPEYLERQLSAFRGRGRRGCSMLDQVLAWRRGLKTTDSALETKLFQVLRRGGLPLPQRQIPVYDRHGIFIARPDFLYPDVRLAIEGLSRKHHSGLWDIDADALRRNRLIAAGYRVLEITNRRLDETPSEVCAQVAEALGMRLL